ncbi:MAG: hypothetical protein B6D37_02515 [Sphingobacteriales bacterium UTBCD1]|jgi:predicted HAD superfamily phosphohydrolase|nr:MAG: hypothetical protein B6D37_02515 [Sphingobacteriales bacterium UTBCD1]
MSRPEQLISILKKHREEFHPVVSFNAVADRQGGAENHYIIEIKKEELFVTVKSLFQKLINCSAKKIHCECEEVVSNSIPLRTLRRLGALCG